jgi:hypothetical protein
MSPALKRPPGLDVLSVDVELPPDAEKGRGNR